MIISSWNINSVRIRTENINQYLKKKDPDILMFQEIKCEDDKFPYKFFEEKKYNCYVYGQKSYNGVAIISKKKLSNIDKSFKDPNNQSRLISSDIEINGKLIKLICIYLPNGNPVNTDKYSYKLNWLKNFISFLKKEMNKYEGMIIGGDFNIIPNSNDVDNPEDWENDALYRLEVRKEFRKIINLGFKDSFRLFNNEDKQYTFWDYTQGSWQRNKGLRIDHFLISDKLIKNIKNVEIDKFTRGLEKPSDHAPIRITI
jgi:exodeoxyribonuclease-3